MNCRGSLAWRWLWWWQMQQQRKWMERKVKLGGCFTSCPPLSFLGAFMLCCLLACSLACCGQLWTCCAWMQDCCVIMLGLPEHRHPQPPLLCSNSVNACRADAKDYAGHSRSESQRPCASWLQDRPYPLWPRCSANDKFVLCVQSRRLSSAERTWWLT